MYATTTLVHQVDAIVRRESDAWSVCSELFRVSDEHHDKEESEEKELDSRGSESIRGHSTSSGDGSSDEEESKGKHMGSRVSESTQVHSTRSSVGSSSKCGNEYCCHIGTGTEEEEDEREPVVFSLMLQKVHSKISKDDMVKFIEVIYFNHCVDYFYLPFNLQTGKNKGMAFVKFKSPRCVRAFEKLCKGLTSADVLDLATVTPNSISSDSLEEVLTLRKDMNKRRHEHTLRKYKRTSPCVCIKMSPSKKQSLREHLFEKSRSKNISNPKFMPVVFRNGKARDVTEDVKIELLIAEEVKDMLWWCREGETD